MVKNSNSVGIGTTFLHLTVGRDLHFQALRQGFIVPQKSLFGTKRAKSRLAVFCEGSCAC